MKMKKISIIIVMIVIFLAGAAIFVQTNKASNDIILPAEEIHMQDGIDIEKHDFSPRE